LESSATGGRLFGLEAGSLRHAVEEFLARAFGALADAEEEFIVEGNGGGVGVGAELVFGDFLEGLAGFKDDGVAIF